MMRTKMLFGMLIYAAFVSLACAQSASNDQTTGLMTNFISAAQSINGQLVGTAVKTAGAALLLQWIATHWREVFSGELASMLAKSVGVISWFGFTVWLLDHQNLLSTAFNAFLTLAGSLGHVEGKFDAFSIMSRGVDLITAVNAAIREAVGEDSFLGIGTNIVGSLSIVISDLLIFLSFLIVAVSVFIATVEFWMMFAVAPLIFGLIPLQAFREQGLAPIKGVISLGLRVVILGVIIGVMYNMTQPMLALQLPSGEGMFTNVWYYLAGLATCAFMALHAGKVATAITSGSASFSGSDVIAAGAATGAVVGAAAGIAKVKAGAAKEKLGGINEGIRNRDGLQVSEGSVESFNAFKSNTTLAPGGTIPEDPSKIAAAKFSAGSGNGAGGRVVLGGASVASNGGASGTAAVKAVTEAVNQVKEAADAYTRDPSPTRDADLQRTMAASDQAMKGAVQAVAKNGGPDGARAPLAGMDLPVAPQLARPGNAAEASIGGAGGSDKNSAPREEAEKRKIARQKEVDRYLEQMARALEKLNHADIGHTVSTTIHLHDADR